MSLTGAHLEQLSQLVEAATSIVIALPSEAQMDETSAALAWATLLEKRGKEVRLIAAAPPALDGSQLPGVEKITDQLGKQNLVVSFEYSPEQVDKVSYHIGEETNRFYLTIRPKQGFDPLSKDSLDLSYAGAQADLNLYVGVADLDDLSPLSEEYGEFFHDTPSIVLSHNETDFGTVKCVAESAAGLCEETAQLFVQLGWELEEPVATLLLHGIESATNGLTALSTTPDTFETVALLLRAGARRSHNGSHGGSGAREVSSQQSSQQQSQPTKEIIPQQPQPPQESGEQVTKQQSQSLPTKPPRTINDVLNRGKMATQDERPSKKRNHYQGRKH
ncbi:MAG: hypothetical protein WC760_13595 [Bacteroidia bacterium]|jgi:hypothetical protein